MSFTESSNKKRVLSVFSLVMINVIAIDSLRNLPANAEMGFTIAFFYIITGILFLLPCVLITAELATHHPKTGGTYVWVREAFGPEWGFLNIWLQWIYNVVWYPTILSFIGANIAYLIEPSLASSKTFMISMIIIIFSLATILNSFGMKLSGLLSTISATVGTLIPMLFIIGLGAFWMFSNKSLAITPTLSHFFPDLSNFHNIAFIVIVIFSLMGLEMSAVHAEEVKNPQKDYPRALYISSTIIILTLIFSSAAIAIVIPHNDLNIITGLDQAYAKFLTAFHLQWLLPITLIAILLGGFGGMAAWVIGPSKGMMVAAQDGSLPKILSYQTKKNVPIAILILQWVIVIALCSLFYFIKYISTSYWILSDLTAQLALLFYILFFAAAIRLRYTTQPKPGAFLIPGGKIGIWLVAGVGILTCITAIILGFIPPASINVGDIVKYEAILIVGIIIFAAPPFIFRALRKK